MYCGRAYLAAECLYLAGQGVYRSGVMKPPMVSYSYIYDTSAGHPVADATHMGCQLGAYSYYVCFLTRIPRIPYSTYLPTP